MGKIGATADHGELTGLGDDDHTIYGLVSGVRDFNHIVINGSQSPAVGADGYGISITPTFVEAGSGVHNIITGVYIAPPVITNAAATTFISSSLYIQGAPSIGTHPYALFVSSGAGYFGNTVEIVDRLGIGIGTTATARLHLAAGSATASTGPLKMTSGALLATPEAGSIEFYDGRFYLTGTGIQRAIDRTSKNVNVANVTVAATAVETTLYSWSLSANAAKVGRIYKVYLDGILSAAANKTLTLNFYFGGVLYVTSVTTPGNISNKPWHAEYSITVRTTGVNGTTALHRHLNINGVDAGVSSLQALDTTAANAITLKAQWSDNNAGNSITLYQAYLEFKN